MLIGAVSYEHINRIDMLRPTGPLRNRLAWILVITLSNAPMQLGWISHEVIAMMLEDLASQRLGDHIADIEVGGDVLDDDDPICDIFAHFELPAWDMPRPLRDLALLGPWQALQRRCCQCR